MILAPKEMLEAKTDKTMAQACFTKAGLEEESYRLGNTKARLYPSLITKP